MALIDTLYAGESLLNTLQNDSEIITYLKTKKFPVDLATHGMEMVKRAMSAQLRRDTIEGDQVGLTQALNAEFVEVRSEFVSLRQTAERAVEGQPGAFVKLALRPRRRHDKKSIVAAAGTPTAAQPPTAPATGREEAASAEEKSLPRFVPRARKFLTAALGDIEILKALAPYGYTKEEVADLLARVEALGAKDQSQEGAIGRTRGASSEFRKTASEFRLWYLPWRLRLRRVLKGRTDYKRRLGLVA